MRDEAGDPNNEISTQLSAPTWTHLHNFQQLDILLRNSRRQEHFNQLIWSHIYWQEIEEIIICKNHWIL